MDPSHHEWIVVGQISGLFGVRGWVRVFSYTDPITEILKYTPWHLKKGDDWIEAEVDTGKVHGKGIIAHIRGWDDRDNAAEWLHCDIGIQRSQLAPLSQGEYYWVDLIGLKVTNLEGIELGTVTKLFETGANDVMVVRGEREHLIPYVMGVIILDIDLNTKTMRVDWGEDY